MKRNEALRFRNVQIINRHGDPDRKPYADIPFSWLRRMAQLYPIARACINRRRSQLTQLEWDITTIDAVTGETGYETQIAAVKAFLRHPTGHRSSLRSLISQLIDDILTLDAACYEMQKTRGGEFLSLITVDPTTISLRITETGGTPEPPDTAYVQIIQGQEIDQFTTAEMLYLKMSDRSYTPYGVSPLESLIIQVQSALRGAMYNLAYFQEGNVPEGFITLPTDVASSKAQVEEWQMWFDALVAGDPRYTARLKFLPGGSEYKEAKKPEDMAFEKFELWLLQQTCAVFDVPPQDIGITYQVNKATSESQTDLSRERGLLPLGNFIKEFFDVIIQEFLGFEQLQFEWININPVDRKEEIEIAEKEIKLGVLSGDEYRIAHGQDPIGLDHYIETSSGPIKVADFIKGVKTIKDDPEKPDAGGKGDDEEEEDIDEEAEKMEVAEIRKWRDCIYKDIKMGRDLRTKFESDKIRPDVHEEISKGLRSVHSRFQCKVFFDQYLDPEVKASLTLLRYANKIRTVEKAGLTP